MELTVLLNSSLVSLYCIYVYTHALLRVYKFLVPLVSKDGIGFSFINVFAK